MHLFGYISSMGGTKETKQQLLADELCFHQILIRVLCPLNWVLWCGGISSASLTTFPGSSGYTSAQRSWWSHHLLLGAQRHAHCFYSGWIIEWDKEEHFISASQIINHCHHVRLFAGVSTTGPPDPQLWANFLSGVNCSQLTLDPGCLWVVELSICLKRWL